jgi:hypothetical protein
MIGSQVMWVTGRSTGRPASVWSRTPSRVTTAISPSSRIRTSRVWARMAGTSDATKYSPLPSPTTTPPAPVLAATSAPGSRSERTPTA